jgi:hypothetical protein
MLVDWQLSECGNKLIGVCTEANNIKGAEAADFFFNSWYLKILTDDGILHVPGGIHCSRKTLD